MQNLITQSLTLPLEGSTYRSPRQRIFALVFPTATLLTALICSGLIWGRLGWSVLVPDFIAPVIFFWSVHQPRWMPVLLVFTFGMASDIMDATPLGVQAASYLMLALLTRTQAAALGGLGFLFNWALFAVLMAGFVVLKFALSLLGTPGIFDHSLRPAILQSLQLVLTTIIAYVPFHLSMSALNRLIVGARGAD